MSAANGKLAMHGGKASKAEVLRRAIAEVGLSSDGTPDHDKILAVARRLMNAYPPEQRVELTPADSSKSVSLLKASGTVLPEPGRAACAVTAQASPSPEAYTPSEIRAAAACLRQCGDDVNRAIDLLTVLGDR